jgi:NitT/TauT family transport system ATP-binding protein
MDEPFGALDAQTKERMQTDLLDTWSASRKTVVFVTHDLEEAILLADKIIVMSARPGRIQHIEEVALPRPRTNDMRLTDDFLAIKRRLWNMLDH